MHLDAHWPGGREEKKNPAFIQKKVIMDSDALCIVNKDEAHNPSQAKNLGATKKLHLEVRNLNHN